MTGPLRQPGLHIGESAGMPPSIALVPTSIAGFVGGAAAGPLDEPVAVGGVAEFEDVFGPLARTSPMAYAVRHFFAAGGAHAVVVRVAGSGADGAVTDADVAAPALEAEGRGLWALDRAPDVALLCVPPLAFGADGDVGPATRAAAARWCGRHGAILVADPPAAWTDAAAVAGPSGIDGAAWGLGRDPNVALYFPRIVVADPLQGGRLATFAPCGAVAGTIARLDAAHGAWRAPAGVHATLAGVADVAVPLDDRRLAALGALGVNCLRAHPRAGVVAWGGRTLAGADGAASEWRYLPVRRLALLVERSLQRGLQWAAFEPDGEPLRAHVRRTVSAFLHDLFARGTFVGSSPDEAYFARCDDTTTTRGDVDRGIVNVLVGFAPLKPAEFVVIRIGLRVADPAGAPPPASPPAPDASLAIAAATAVLRDVVRRAVADADLAALLGVRVTVSALPADYAGDAAAGGVRLHVALVDVAHGAVARNAPPAPAGADASPHGARPVALDLRYLVSAHAADELHAEIALGHAVRALHERAVATSDDVRAALAPTDDAAGGPALRALAARGAADRIERIRIAQLPTPVADLASLRTAMRVARGPCALYGVGVTVA